LYSAAYLGENTWSRSPLPQTGEVERHGPYVYVRHPLYGANLLILTGYAVYSGALWLTVLTVLAFGFQYYCVAKYEDSVLEEHFGESFVDYVRAVPAWIPARPISWEELDWPATWAKAIATEKRTFVASGLMIIALLFLG
jgi:protein-S-isoprenylcysteine O-methyltransferase Ste14